MKARTDRGPNALISLDDFLFTASQAKSAQGLGTLPTDGTLELTRRCNFRCVHCYIGDARWTPDPRELSTSRVKELLDVLADRGTLTLKITGGEATLRPDFREVWVYARQKGFLLTLFTNAALIDEEMADFLAEHPSQSIEVSIYGATRETFERVTLNKHSFERFFRAIELIRTRGLKWLLKAPVIPGVKEELPLIRELAARWGVELMLDGAITPSIGEGETGGMAPCSTRLSEEENYEEDIRGVDAQAFGTLLSEEMLRQPPPAKEEDLFSCGAGNRLFYVTARGNFQMCVLTGHRAEPMEETLPVAESFDRAWRKFGEARKVKLRQDSPCHGCDIAGICKSCPGFAHLETGDEHGAVAWLCRNTHLRAHKLGLPHKCDIKHFVYSAPVSMRDSTQGS